MFNGKIYSNTPEFKGFMALRSFFHFCPMCGNKLAIECQEHDPCIRDCPGTEDACCGHGIIECAYVTVENKPFLARKVLRGEEAIDYFQEQGLAKPYASS